MSFFSKLNRAISLNQSLLVVGLDPNPEMMPEKYISGNKINKNQYKDWLTEIINQTAMSVCAYKPTLGFYQALGAKGIELLVEILQIIPSEIPVILDAKHGDLNSGSLFAEYIFEELEVDAVTLSPYPGQDLAIPFLLYPDKGIFILCSTSNPSAVLLQEYNSQKKLPFYLKLVKEVKNWGSPEQLFLEVGTVETEILKNIRTEAPERTILLRSFWSTIPRLLDSQLSDKSLLPSESPQLASLLKSGLNEHGEGLILPIPQDWLKAENLSEKLNQLNQQLQKIRIEVTKQNDTCELWVSNVCILDKHPHQDLILQLYDLGCILFGEYVQASGAVFPYYVDLRKIISEPQIFHQILQAYAEIVKKLDFDRIAGIPYGALPTATGLSLMLHHPLIFPRKEVKAHGTRRLVEGHYQPGEKVVVIDDILISGKSAIEGAEKLKSCGLEIEDIVVFINHEQGVIERLKQAGYQAHSVLSISEITETLYSAGKINQEQYQCFH